MTIRIETIYSGRVQGVGFRYTTYELAKRYPVTGYVRNLADGAVQMIVEGETTEIQALLALVRERFARKLSGETNNQLPATGEFATFEIRG